MKRKPQHVSNILPANSWEGQRAFIIGGGPSLREMSLGDRKALTNEKVIGTNKAFRDFPCDINVVLDRGLYQKLYFPKKEEQKELSLRFKYWEGIKIFANWKPSWNWVPDSKRYIFDVLKKKELSYDPDKIYCGNNSGFAAMMLAVALGSREIYLLGMDMQTQGKVTHYHEGYRGQSPLVLEDHLKQFRKCFTEFAPILAEAGVKVFDCSLTGALQCFPKVKVDCHTDQSTPERL